MARLWSSGRARLDPIRGRHEIAVEILGTFRRRTHLMGGRTIAVPARERKLKRGVMAKQQMTAALAVEDDLLARARRGEEPALRAIVQQNNRRLFRLARSIVRDEHEAEDVVQECYVRAFTHLSEFRGESSLATWLTRITLNEAYGRLRRRRAAVNVENIEAAGANEAQIIPFPLWSSQPDPERSMAQQQINKILERAIDALPEPFRLVLVARLIEDMSIEETADLLGLRPQTVKTRLHRARAMLRGDLERQVGPLLTGVFPFDGVRCQRMADAVIARLRALGEVR
jgi:RNA polymerase sigma-70 factor (ECF subfamily)